MGHNQQLFERLSGYGLHAIQVHYANGWFGKLNKEPPPDDQYLGRIRLEAATGTDVSDAINIPQPDGMTERSYQLVKWLSQEHRPGHWEYFLTPDKKSLRWDDVIIAGISHGSTTAAGSRCSAGRPSRDVLRPARSAGELVHAAIGDSEESVLRLYACPRWRLDRRPLLPVVGAVGLQEFGPRRRCGSDQAPFGNSAD